MRILTALIALLLVAFQPAAQTTVRECLTKVSGGVQYSTAATGPAAFNDLVLNDQGVPVNLYDRPAVIWPDYVSILTTFDYRSMVTVETDTGNRPLLLLQKDDALYVFVFMHRDNPRRRLPGEPLATWHGDCFLRLL